MGRPQISVEMMEVVVFLACRTCVGGLLRHAHLQIPLDKNQEPQDSGSSASMSDKIKTAHGGSVFAATRPVAVLSSVGLRAGISAPPELAQAVLEGVFWSRCGVTIRSSRHVVEEVYSSLSLVSVSRMVAYPGVL